MLNQGLLTRNNECNEPWIPFSIDLYLTCFFLRFRFVNGIAGVPSVCFKALPTTGVVDDAALLLLLLLDDEAMVVVWLLLFSSSSSSSISFSTNRRALLVSVILTPAFCSKNACRNCSRALCLGRPIVLDDRNKSDDHFDSLQGLLVIVDGLIVKTLTIADP